MNSKNIFKRLFPYLKKYKYHFLIMVILSILGNTLTLIGPYLVGKAINQIHINMSKDNFIFLSEISIALLFTYISGAFLTLTQNIKMNNISQNIVNNMRCEAFAKIHKFSLKDFEKLKYGEIITVLINDIDNISSSLSQIGTRIIVSILSIVIALGIMIYISPTLTFIQLILVFTTYLFLKYIMSKAKAKRRKQQKCLSKMNGYVDEILRGQAEVKSFSYEEIAIENFKKLNKEYTDNAIKSIFFSGFNFPTLNLINNIGYTFIILIGAIFMINGKLTLGELSSFIIYSKLFNRPIASISEAYNIIQTVLVSSERYFHFMDLKEDYDNYSLELNRNNIVGDINFENVTFTYDGQKKVLNNLSFKAKAGQTIAIVGETGGGKTTIVNLLMRFYDIDSGKILLDGIVISKYKKSDIRKLFGMVLQDTWLFSGTIKENIKYGNNNITDDDIIKACKIVGAHDFITKLEEGYNTNLAENNMILSEGQKQLLTIARIIASSPKFLILDEATSGVDTRTELNLQKAISSIIKGRTSFIIAHRLSTIKNADLILVLKNGEILESGTHEELLKLKKYYYEMYSHQYLIK